MINNQLQPYFIYPGAMRKDGKIPTQLVYPISGRRFTRLLTLEQLTYKQNELRDQLEREKAVQS